MFFLNLQSNHYYGRGNFYIILISSVHLGDLWLISCGAFCVQIQSAWAYGNDVNLLAAGASVPLSGSTGTGIYNGRKGALVSVMNKRLGERKLYVAQVPKFQDTTKRQKRAVKAVANPRLSQTDIFLKRDYVQNYVSALLNLTALDKAEHEFCYFDGLCCKFELSWKQRDNLQPNTKYYNYRLGVYDGLRNEVAAELNHIKSCAIFSCISDDIADCGKIFASDSLVEPQVEFDKIIIEGSFPITGEYLLMPNSLQENLYPLPVDSFKWTETNEDSNIKVRFETTKPTSDLLTMAIYGDYYDGEVPPPKGDGAAAVKVSAILMALIFAWFLY